MKNPKTTIAGYLLLLASVATVAAHLLGGSGLGQADIAAVIGAIGGLGLVGASDGGH
jgi:hypothetical protein